MLFPDWRRGIAELVRATRPSGRVIMATWANPEGTGPMPLFMQAYRRVFPDATIPPLPTGVEILSLPEALKTEMVGAGCVDVAVHAINETWSGPSVNGVMGEIDQILRPAPLYAALDVDGRARLHGPLRAAIETHAEQSGEFRVPATANIAVGRRCR